MFLQRLAGGDPWDCDPDSLLVGDGDGFHGNKLADVPCAWHGWDVDICSELA